MALGPRQALALALACLALGAATPAAADLVEIKVSGLTLVTKETSAKGVKEIKSSEAISSPVLEVPAYLNDDNEVVVELSLTVDKSDVSGARVRGRSGSQC